MTAARALTGVRPLLAVTVRQELRRSLPWIVLVAVLSASSILAYAWIFPDAVDRLVLARTLGSNPALAIVFGTPHDLVTADGFNAWRAGQLGALLAGVMAVGVVVRSSRADEDSGQAELVASGVVARGTRLVVALLAATVCALVLGVVTVVLTVASGGSLLPSTTLAAGFVASALMFAAVAAVTAQLATDARGASSLAVAALGVCFVLRGYLDVADVRDGAAWSTPFGWISLVRSGVDDDLRPLLAACALAVVLAACAALLQARRDFGQGLVAPRPGRERAGLAGSVVGLPWVLHRRLLTGWIVGLTLLGVVLGTLVASAGDVLAGGGAIGDLLGGGADGGSLALMFATTVLQLVAILAAVMGVQIAMGLYTEESEHRVEPLLAGALRRPTLLAAYLALALVATAVAMLLAGTTLGLVAHASDASVPVGDVVAQALATVPAVWVLLALAFAAVGAVPSRRIVGWAGVAATFGLTIIGPTFNLWDWALDISPLRHVPAVWSAAPGWGGLVGLGVVIVLLLAAAFAGYRRRDVG